MRTQYLGSLYSKRKTNNFGLVWLSLKLEEVGGFLREWIPLRKGKNRFSEGITSYLLRVYKFYVWLLKIFFAVCTEYSLFSLGAKLF